MLLRFGCRVALIVLVGGLLSATMMRYAPGFDSEPEQLDSRWSETALRLRSESRAGEHNVMHFYGRFLAGYLRGDLGESRLLQQPVAGLLRDRVPTTVLGTGFGLGGGWLLALLAASATVLSHNLALEAGTRAGATALQCLPAAVLGLLLLSAGGAGTWVCGVAIALVLYPRLVSYLLNLFQDTRRMPHIITARAKGAGEWRVLTRHVFPVVLPELLALAGVSVSLALSAAIPLEMVLDVPGVGQLAWQAALGRDLTLLVNITVLLSVAITAANAAADGLARSRSTVEPR